jgi:uncharacterized membrane protein YqjE
MPDLKQKIKAASALLLQNLQNLVPKFSFDWPVLTSSLEGYIEARMALFKLELKEMLSGFAERLILGIAILSLVSLAVLMFSLGLALLINHYVGNQFTGFLAVAGFYLVGAGAIGWYAWQKFGPKVTPVSKVETTRLEDKISWAQKPKTPHPEDWKDKWDDLPDIENLQQPTAKEQAITE